MTADITFYEEKGEKIRKNTYRDKKSVLQRQKTPKIEVFTKGCKIKLLKSAAKRISHMLEKPGFANIYATVPLLEGVYLTLVLIALAF